jgi:large subunit ribosomal protein L25
VPLVVVGESEGVKTYNGVLLMAIESVQVEALPLDIPSRIEVDVTPLENLEDSLQVKDLPIPPDVTILTDPDMVVVKVSTPRVAVEEAAEAAEEAEAEAAAEGEAPAAEAEGDSEEKEGE